MNINFPLREIKQDSGNSLLFETGLVWLKKTKNRKSIEKFFFFISLIAIFINCLFDEKCLDPPKNISGPLRPETQPETVSII